MNSYFVPFQRREDGVSACMAIGLNRCDLEAGVPLPRLSLPEGARSEDIPPLLKFYVSAGSEMAPPSGGVYGRAGEEAKWVGVIS